MPFVNQILARQKQQNVSIPLEKKKEIIAKMVA